MIVVYLPNKGAERLETSTAVGYWLLCGILQTT